VIFKYEESSMSRTDPEIGLVIAERSLQRRDSPRRTVVVSLGKPRRTKSSQDWECPLHIRGLGMRRVQYARGVDAFQALTMALEGIRFFLDRSRKPLAWKGVLDDTGFQRVMPLLPEPGGTRRMERLVDREMGRRLKRLKQRHGRRRGQKLKGAAARLPRATAP
jgi:hypothetical protein